MGEPWLSQVIAAEMKAMPVIVFVRKARQLAGNAHLGQLFKAELGKLQGRVVFIGSHTEGETEKESVGPLNF